MTILKAVKLILVSQIAIVVCCVPLVPVHVSFCHSGDEGEPKRKTRNRGSLKETFHKEMRKVFPWFDVRTGRVQDCSDVPE